MEDCAGIIDVRGLTKDYGPNRGVFDVSFSVRPGEALGFLGANGAGKTVTMRILMGFIRPDSGRAHVDGRDCFSERASLQRMVGYLPGELACPEGMTGKEYLNFIACLRRMDARGRTRMSDLIDYFELDPGCALRRMSKGTKQKVGIIAAFMHSPDVLLLDEPTSGLDLLMQQRFVALLEAEKKRGAAIVLSSHLLGEVERTCDRALFIRNGRMVAEHDAGGLTLEATLISLYGDECLDRQWGEGK